MSDEPLNETTAPVRRPWLRWMRRLGWLIVAALAVLLLLLWQSSHPIARLLKSRLTNWLAERPSVELSFERAPTTRPAIESGGRSTPMLAMDPCVLGDAEGLHLFYSTVFIESDSGLTQFWSPSLGEQFDISKLVTGIAYAHSQDDGLTWSIRTEPLLLPSASGWDDYRVETASAVVRQNRLHIFYCGDTKELIGRYQVGEVSIALDHQSIRDTLLSSETPLERQRSSPILPADFQRSGFHNNLQEPSVVLRDEGFELYFVGLQLSEPEQSLATTGQQLRRVGMGRARLNGSLQVQEITEEPLIEFANIIEVRRTHQGLIAFVTLPGEGDAHQGERIAYYTSEDGRSWSKYKTVLSPRSGQFDNWACMSPTAVYRNDRWLLFYTALRHDSNRPADRWAIALGNDGWLQGSLGRAEGKRNEDHK